MRAPSPQGCDETRRATWYVTPGMWYARLGTVPFRVLLATLAAGSTPAMEWNPRAYQELSTVEVRTLCPGEGELWFPVWLVSLDDQIYIRLGPRAAGRIRCNQTSPYVAVRVGERQFDHVKGIETPEEAQRVADAMAAKYWSDLVIRFLPHPMTLRLVPE